ncbi:MAG TPA: M15 family metallopeptidase [Micromonosporaceae bacterium]|jgi:primosomal protein N'
MSREPASALAATETVLATAALDAGGVLDPAAASRTDAVAAAVDAGVVAPTLRDPLSDDELQYVNDQLASDPDPTARAAALIGEIAQRRNVPLGRLSAVNSEDFLTNPDPDAALAQRAEVTDADRGAFAIASDVGTALRRLLRVIRAEWSGYPAHVREVFEQIASDRKTPSLEYYRLIRASMVRAGWRDPAGVWRQIQAPGTATLLGLPIQHGAHSVVIDLLKAGAEDLTVAPVDANAPIRTVNGFQPRVVENSQTLSNHAWGLALDVDATWNPYITDRQVMDVLRRHSSENLDIAKDVIDRSVPNTDKLDKRYEKLSRLSKDIEEWLKTAVNTEHALSDAVEKAEEKRRLAAKSNDRTAIEKAEQAVAKARHELADSQDAQDVRILARHQQRDKDVLETWRTSGVLTLPLELIQKLRAHGFGWGGEYENKKDFMHFELHPDGRLSREQPDAGGGG